MVLTKIGLTGATGMLGRHIRAVLQEEGSEVLEVTRGVAGNRAKDWDLAEWRQPEELDSIFEGVQAIVHSGAMVQSMGPEDDARMFNSNVRACVNLGVWASSRNVPIVHISSAVVYADPAMLDISEDSTLGWSGLGGFYGLTKLLAEDALSRLADRGLKCAVIRPSSLYGFGLPKGKLVMNLLEKAKAGVVIALKRPVDDRIDLVHASDVAYAVAAVLKKETWDVFNIASGRPVSIIELAEACASAAGAGSTIRTEGEVSMRLPQARFALKTVRAQEQLGWQAQCELKHGLQMMLDQRRIHLVNPNSK